jgi:ribosomal protein L10
MAKVGFAVVVLPNMTTKRVLEGTPFSNMAPLFWSSTCVMHGDELGNVESLLKVLKAPSFLVVGAKVDNRLLTPAQLKDAAKLPGMDAARAMLVASISPASQLQRLTGMLMAPAQGFHSTLQSSQSGLVSALQRHASKSDDEKQ